MARFDTVYAQALYRQGKSFREIAAKLGNNESVVRRWFKRHGIKPNQTQPNQYANGVPPNGSSPWSEMEDRTVIDSGDALEVKVHVQQLVETEDEQIKAARVDLTRWERDRLEVRHYPIQTADGPVQGTYIRATFKRRKGLDTPAAIGSLTDGILASRGHTPWPLTPAVITRSGMMQVLVIADPHFGKLCWGRGTGGQDYDLDIARSTVLAGSQYLMAMGHGVERRMVVTLGDIFHFDTLSGTTTGGTFVDRDSRIDKMLQVGADTISEVVRNSSDGAETEFLAVPGNHDRVLTSALQRIMVAEFRGTGVEVDDTHTTRKARLWGATMVAFNHGDKRRKELLTTLPIEHPELWGRSRHRDMHVGHLHSEGAKYEGTLTHAGATLYAHRSLSPADAWHAEEGYIGAPRGMQAFTYHRNGGLVRVDYFDPDLAESIRAA